MILENELYYWQSFIDGDIEALSKLYLMYIDELYSYGMKIWPDEYLVRDSIQEVFIQIIEKQKRLKLTTKIKTYIFKSLRNKILEELRSKFRRKVIASLIFKSENKSTMSVELSFIKFEENQNKAEIISLALNELSVHQREAIFLRYSNGYEYSEIAEIMGITIASARTLIFRSLKKLKVVISKKTSLAMLIKRN